ncbi:MAG: SDR family oxidoreductase [Bacteroidales bacterium]|nr:SDR family oxidoreductase [Bacteroidales bacterium]
MTGGKALINEKYILTGATGFLGSHIMAGLLSKGKGLVILGRSSGGDLLKARISKLLKWFGIEHLEELLEFYETDFQKKSMGLGENEFETLCKRRLAIIHCASDTSFNEKSRDRVIRSNVDSLSEILNFATISRAKFFHLISSAYAAGTDRIECYETPVISEHYNNVYEESKALAENIVAQRCRKEKLPYTIIRPSVVYGDSVTGRSLRFNALYYPVRSLQLIRDIYLADIKNNKGKKSSECGIHINKNGILYLPVRIFIPDEGKINLIPVNYFTEALFSILEKPSTEAYYHITSNNPQTMANLVTYTERFLNITGIEVIIGTPSADELRNPAEELFDYFIREYKPYIADRRIFIRENTNGVSLDFFPPDLSYEIFERCMNFAVSADWGRNLFNN